MQTSKSDNKKQTLKDFGGNLLKFTEFIINQEDVIDQFKSIVQLDFEKTISKGNLCFARNNEELRDEFKQVFTPVDLLDYWRAIFHFPTATTLKKENLISEEQGIAFPKNAESFWRLVEIGKTSTPIHKKNC
jgi:hypothetical protein